jgi:hypothetical protein
MGKAWWMRTFHGRENHFHSAFHQEIFTAHLLMDITYHGESVDSQFISSGRSAAKYHQCQKPVPLVFSIFNRSHSTLEFQKPLEHSSAPSHVLSRGKF